MSKNKHEVKADVSDLLKNFQGLGLNAGNMVPAQKGQVYREKKETVSEYHVDAAVEGGFKPPYPMSYQGASVKEEMGPMKWGEGFSDGVTGKVDPELNQMALEEVAASRGLSVEELLAEQGKSFEKEEINYEEEQERPMTDLERAEELKKQLKAIEEQLNFIENQKAQSVKVPAPQPAKTQFQPINKPNVLSKLQSTSKDILHPQANNPVLAKIRQKLALSSIKPEEVTVEGIHFELLPPPGSLQPWMLSKLQNIAEVFGGDETVMANTLKNIVFSTSVVRIDKMPTVEALELVPQGTVPDIHQITEDLSEVGAQALWEMATGTSSVGLPRLHPEVVTKVYNAYNSRFKENAFSSSIDPQKNRFICPIEGCVEQFDKDSGTEYFCPVHGVSMTDLGPLKDLKSGPLA